MIVVCIAFCLQPKTPIFGKLLVRASSMRARSGARGRRATCGSFDLVCKCRAEAVRLEASPSRSLEKWATLSQSCFVSDSYMI